jgi:hypothetical protein
MHIVSNLFDSYNSIPRGAYYYRYLRFPQETETNGWSPFAFLSKKRFEGFVTSELEFRFDLEQGIMEFPDRTFFISWGLDRLPSIDIRRKSDYSPSAQIALDQQAIIAALSEQKEYWAQRIIALAEQKAERKIEEDKTRNWPLPPSNFQGTLEEYRQTLIEEFRRIPNQFDFVLTRHKARKIGFIPFTTYWKIKSFQEMLDFAFRWLDEKEGGISFYRPVNKQKDYQEDNIESPFRRYQNKVYARFLEHLRRRRIPDDGRVLNKAIETWIRSTGFRFPKGRR